MVDAGTVGALTASTGSAMTEKDFPDPSIVEHNVSAEGAVLDVLGSILAPLDPQKK